MKIAQHLGIRGPCCIQMKTSADDVIKLIEINPRLGDGTIFIALAGANFPKMILDMVLCKKVDVPSRSWYSVFSGIALHSLHFTFSREVIVVLH
jgi:carbamoyl-phosphate synthase large subunit